MTDYTPVTERDEICQSRDCDALVPAGTRKYHLPGPRIMCEPCQEKARTAWGNYKRGVFVANARRREKDQLQRDAFTSEGGSLGALYECARCDEDYLADRPHFHTHPTTQHLCDTCEHIYWAVNRYEHDLRRDHGQSVLQLRRDQRQRRGLRPALRRAQH